MAEQLFEILRRLGIFMLCAQTIVHFRPKQADEKYIRLLVSIMILIQLLIPVGSVVLEGVPNIGAAESELQEMIEKERFAEESAPLTLDEVLQNFQSPEAYERESTGDTDSECDSGDESESQMEKERTATGESDGQENGGTVKAQRIEIKEIEKIRVGE